MFYSTRWVFNLLTITRKLLKTMNTLLKCINSAAQIWKRTWAHLLYIVKNIPSIVHFIHCCMLILFMIFSSFFIFIFLKMIAVHLLHVWCALCDVNCEQEFFFENEFGKHKNIRDRERELNMCSLLGGSFFVYFLSSRTKTVEKGKKRVYKRS